MNAQEIAEVAIAVRNGIVSDATRFPKELGEASYLPESEIRGIGHGLKDAPVVIWTPEMFELASGGYEVFTGLHFSKVPMPSTPEFWYFHQFHFDPNEIIVSEQAKVPSNYLSYSMIFWPAGFRGAEVPLIIYVCCPDPDLGKSGRIMLRMLRSDGEARDGVTRKYAGQMLAAYAFTQEKIAARETVVLPRASRRRMQREDQVIPDIRIIQLRQRQHEENGGQSVREYHCSWIVRGHWRRLHQPRKSDGVEVTFVHAYVKGEGPLLPPRESVFVVGR